MFAHHARHSPSRSGRRRGPRPVVAVLRPFVPSVDCGLWTVDSGLPGSRFNTSVTQMVQNIGNTFEAVLDRLSDAVEKSRAYEPEKRVCLESDPHRQLSAVVPGIRD